MSIPLLPWLEMAILLPLLGALCTAFIRDSNLGYRCSAVSTGLTFLCTLMVWLGQFEGISMAANDWLLNATHWRPLTVDGLSAPLLAVVALLHFLAALTKARSRIFRFTFTGILVSEAITLATFSCIDPWTLIVLLVLGTIPPYVELASRGLPTRVYAIHMFAFVGLLTVGWACASGSVLTSNWWATVPLLLAVLIRCGTVPAHCWLTDLFEHASFGMALCYVAPLTGVYAAVRLVLPIAPDWVLQGLGLVSLITALYTAGMAIVQQEARRFFAFLFLSHSSLVLVGLELVTSISLTGSLCLWFSVVLSLGGLGLALRALEARVGRLSLADYHGLYDHSPSLAVCFFLTGMASVGFPGTLGFIATEMLVDGAVEANLLVGLFVVLAAAINGIAVVRVYLLLFTGTRHTSAVPLHITFRERFAVLTLGILIVGGGLIPQPGVASRHHVAEKLLDQRAESLGDEPRQADRFPQLPGLSLGFLVQEE